jgi:hypothetical protein
MNGGTMVHRMPLRINAYLAGELMQFIYNPDRVSRLGKFTP